MQFHKGRRLKNFIGKSGIKIRIVSEKSGISTSTLYTYFDKEHDLPQKKLEKILEVIGISLNEFMGTNSSSEVETLKKEVDYWREKYLEVMEKYNVCLENSNILNKKFKLKNTL